MSRRKAREDTLRLLYLNDLCSSSIEEGSSIIWHEKKPLSSDGEFSIILTRGVIENLSKIDETISNFSQNWSLERMSYIDRNILRFAVYELLYIPETPPKVIINEAIEISKIYSSEKSRAFINGILDRVKNLRASK